MIFAFGDFELDESLYQLRRRGEVVRLEPKVFDVLAYLVRSATASCRRTRSWRGSGPGSS